MVRFSKACSGCGRSIPAGAWCAACADSDPDAPQRPAVEADARRENPGGHWSPWRNRGDQTAFRAGLIRTYGERCMQLVDGRRCTVTSELQAHHLPDGRGMLLCRLHHKAEDMYAR
jgi:hypothetical protein